jgi:hypothetical protein
MAHVSSYFFVLFTYGIRDSYIGYFKMLCWISDDKGSDEVSV